MNSLANTKNKKTILVVEDDADTRLAICSMLETLGYDFVAFGGAREALGNIEGKQIDLALIDIMMPEMNGYELLVELKKIPGFESLPIVMVTARDQDSEIIEGYKCGADYYITKPFTSAQLKYGISTFLE